MHALRTIAVVLLASIAVVAAAGAVLWSASLAGLARAAVVGSSAMAPDFEEGDLVVVTPRPVAELRAGDVVHVGEAASALARVVAVEPVRPGRWSVSTAASDGAVVAEHALGDQAWAPSLRVPVAGGIAAALLEPRYGVPALAIVLLLGAVALLGRAPVSRRRPRAAGSSR